MAKLKMAALAAGALLIAPMPRATAAADPPPTPARRRRPTCGAEWVSNQTADGQRRTGYCTTCWKVGRLTHGIPGTRSAPVGWKWMSSRAGLH